MRTIWTLILLLPLLLGASSEPINDVSYEMQGEFEQLDDVEIYKRGGYISPRKSYNPRLENPSRTTPGRPVNTIRNPANSRTGFGGFFGGLFGGLALGTIFGSLFNPFAGFSLGVPFLSLLSLVFWFFIIFAIVRIFRRRKNMNE